MRTNRRWIILALLVAGCAGLALAQTTENQPPASAPATSHARLTIGPDTTRILGPLRPDGTLDHIAAFNAHFSPGVTPENNAAVLMLQALGPRYFRGDTQGRVLGALGLKELPENGAYYVTLRDFCRKQGWGDGIAEDAVVDESRLEPWRPEADEEQHVAAWLQANEKPLALLIEATKCPRFWMPVAPGADHGLIDLPWNQSLVHDAITTLVLRTMLKLGARDVAGAEADLLTVHRLGRLISQGGTMVERAVGVTIDSQATRADKAWLAYGKVTGADARRMLAELQALPPLGTMPEALDWATRLMMLDCPALAQGPGGMADVAKGVLPDVGVAVGAKGGILVPIGPTSPDYKLLAGIDGAQVDWDVVLRIWNAWCDRLLTIEKLPTWAARQEAWAQMDEERETLRAAVAKEPDVSRRVGTLLMVELIPASPSRFWARAVQEIELVEVGLALRAYRADQGHWPGKLAELAPAYLEQVPEDRYDGKELKYKVTGNEAVAWSVGWDGKNDGGGRFKDIEVRVPRR